MKTIIVLLLTLLSIPSTAQEITGRVLDERKDPFKGVIVRIYESGLLKSKDITDCDGWYAIHQLKPGHYDIEASYPGYDTVTITNAVLETSIFQNFALQPCVNGQKNIIRQYKKTLIDRHPLYCPVIKNK